MPEGFGETLTRFELRDLVEFLGTLRQWPDLTVLLSGNFRWPSRGRCVPVGA